MTHTLISETKLRKRVIDVNMSLFKQWLEAQHIVPEWATDNNSTLDIDIQRGRQDEVFMLITIQEKACEL